MSYLKRNGRRLFVCFIRNSTATMYSYFQRYKLLNEELIKKLIVDGSIFNSIIGFLFFLFKHLYIQ
jgi:hypothetical protein